MRYKKLEFGWPSTRDFSILKYDFPEGCVKAANLKISATVGRCARAVFYPASVRLRPKLLHFISCNTKSNRFAGMDRR